MDNRLALFVHARQRKDTNVRMVEREREKVHSQIWLVKTNCAEVRDIAWKTLRAVHMEQLLHIAPAWPERQQLGRFCVANQVATIAQLLYLKRKCLDRRTPILHKLMRSLLSHCTSSPKSQFRRANSRRSPQAATKKRSRNDKLELRNRRRR